MASNEDNNHETFIDVDIPDNDLQSGAFAVLKDLRPKWNPNDVKFLPLTEGITNKLVGCYHKDDKKKSDGIVLRVYGQMTELIIDRSQEKKNMQVLHIHGCSAPFYATFKNGIAYAFVPGRSLEVEDVSDDHISLLIAKEMAKMHALDTDKVGHYRMTKDPCIWWKTRKYINLSPDSFEDSAKNERYSKNIPSKGKLLAELDILEKELFTMECTMGFCHNDILVKNIIYNSDEDKITFIDYEYGAYNYIPFDIGNHFNEFAGVETVDYSRLPSKEFQMKWIRRYLEARCEMLKESKDNLTNNDIETLYVQVNKFSLVSHFFWGVWALIQAKYSVIDFDYLEYAELRLNEYFAKKEQHLALKLP